MRLCGHQRPSSSLSKTRDLPLSSVTDCDECCDASRMASHKDRSHSPPSHRHLNPLPTEHDAVQVHVPGRPVDALRKKLTS
ncbi:unnamed protein product [Clavelina lepadiformis]|uniref:Uncharacterized protein n=1 Tax=Clavelina lepadiformis TaxID=159417 RepID=A0ABP0EVC9_CLALP